MIDVAPFLGGDTRSPAHRDAARAIAEACRADGFFYVVGHGVDPSLCAKLTASSRGFFALPLEQKLEIAMERGGRAWRGYFPVGGELTSGRPDRKEGVYFGAELADDDPRVRAGLPLHGPNLFPREPADLRSTVLAYLGEMTRVAHGVMRGIAASLGLAATYFEESYTADPFVLFRIFHYPAAEPGAEEGWGVGEHTDYGLLTILLQDDRGGLEVESGGRWIDAPPLPGSFVCNIGDMLDRMTGGRYRSTPHRVRSPRGRSRTSFPFFFDPAFAATVRPIELADGWVVPEDRRRRWDQASLRDLGGSYGDYLLAKVARVFPALAAEALAAEAPAPTRRA